MTDTPLTIVRDWPRQPGELPLSLPDRPTDAESISGFLEWAAACNWPVERPGELWISTDIQWWPHTHWGVAPGLHYQSPFRGLPWTEYAQAMFWWGVGLAASADAVTFLEMGTGEADGEGGLVGLQLQDGSYAELASWQPMRGPDPHNGSRGGRANRGRWNRDSGDLWAWVTAGRGVVGPMAEKNRALSYPKALTTAQRLWDVIALYLPLAHQAEEEEEVPTPSTTKPRRRASKWD